MKRLKLKMTLFTDFAETFTKENNLLRTLKHFQVVKRAKYF